MGQCLYTQIWKNHLSDIIEIIKGGESSFFQVEQEAFENAGNRPSSGYNFRTEFTNGECTNRPSGSAVGRDLAEVVEMSQEFREACNEKFVVIRMGKNFDLHVEVRKLDF
ncbi:MAG: hypothetical protein MJZ93_05545 [Paludibacteraceae bacterium]|nr:hypothetical protein [Paludibacteraceae bacterium]